MARGLTSAVKTELATQRIRPVYLIDIGFPTPIFLTNCSFPITSSVSGSSQTYSNSSHLFKVLKYLCLEKHIHIQGVPKCI